MATNVEPESVVLEYNLFDLPTAQHKAGLAGFLLFIESMKRRRLEPLPVVDEVTSTTARIRMSKDAAQAVFDDLYDAEIVEVQSTTRWTGKIEPKRIEVVEDENGKQKKRFVYDQVQPKGAFLEVFLPENGGSWLKLWRSMIWGVLRSRPKSREVYDRRARSIPYKLDPVWSALDGKGAARSAPVSSSIMIGSQDSTAEAVQFLGSPRENFLLHFWQLASFIFVPRTVSLKRSKERGLSVNMEDSGFVIVVPEPAELDTFVEAAREFLQTLPCKQSGYRPLGAIICLPQEGGLEYMRLLAGLKVRKKELAYYLCGVDVFHLEKGGNNVQTRVADRLVPRTEILEEYEAIRSSIYNPLFRMLRIRNLLDDLSWHERALDLFSSYPWEMFIHVEKSPKDVPAFGNDVRMTFVNRERSRKAGGKMMSGEEQDNQLATRVYRLIGAYVNRRTEEKSGIKYSDLKAGKDEKEQVDYPPKYREAREKVCSDAFLAMRGRRDQDFIEYFTGTICSVPQFLPEAEFVSVSQALIHDWERVKTLSMLALSASSYFAKPKVEGAQK